MSADADPNLPAAPARGAAADPRRAGRGSADPLLFVPRLVLGALEDIRTIADSMRVLPQLAETLGSIGERAEALEAEVTRMRKAVEAMGSEVVGVRASVAPLDERLTQVQGRIEDLEPHLDEVRRVVGPLGGTAARLGRIVGRRGNRA